MKVRGGRGSWCFRSKDLYLFSGFERVSSAPPMADKKQVVPLEHRFEPYDFNVRSFGVLF